MQLLPAAIGRAAVALLVVPSLSYAQRVATVQYTVTDGLAHNTVTRVFQDSRGYMWFATAAGLTRFDGYRFVSYQITDRVPQSPIVTIGETRGSLWLATRAGAVIRANDRFGGTAFFEDRSAAYDAVASGPMDRQRLATLVTATHPQFFEHGTHANRPLIVRGTSARVTDMVEDRGGTLWVATSGAGVFAIPGEFVVNYTALDELPDAHVVRIVESRDGRIYAMTRRGGAAELRDEGVETVPGSIFAPFHTTGRRIVQDERGTWWFWTADGVFTAPGPALSFSQARRVTNESAPRPERSDAPFVDSRGWWWAALPDGGVSLCKDPSFSPRCSNHTKRDGIGHLVTSIAEDTYGRVYLGSSKGLMRFDPTGGGLFRPVPVGDRLAGSPVTHCMRDSRGRMWIATTTGVLVLMPRRPRAARAPQVYLTSLRTGDRNIPVPARGAVALPRLRLESPTSSVRIEYVAPGFEGEGPLRYQHRLNGVDADWSAATTERVSMYSRLPPGSYEFAVRAVTPGGNAGPPALMAVTVPQPIWRRAWWLVGCAAIALLARRLFRQLQRAHGRRDLARVPLGVLGGVEQQPEDRRGQSGAPYGSWLR